MCAECFFQNMFSLRKMLPECWDRVPLLRGWALFQNLIDRFSELNVANFAMATVAMLLEIAPKYDPLSILSQGKGKF